MDFEVAAHAAPTVLTTTAKEKLGQLVARIERLEEERSGISKDITDSYSEAKALGFDSKVLRAVIRKRKQDKQEREEFETIEDLYMHALGMI
jgi:uncharacterized protein (UPF0335 family)